MKDGFGSPLLDAGARLLAPWILLFSLYVLVHGHDSPGGGFQGGTLAAAAFLLLRLVRGGAAALEDRRRGALLLACFGMALFVVVGALPMLRGAGLLDYELLPLSLSSPAIRVLGSGLAEAGIYLAVAGTLLMIHGELDEGRS